MPREDQIITAKNDKPIEKCDEDIFGWKDHARMLAKLITHESNDDVALGISAPWGSGKSSMLNLIKEQINEIGIDPKPIIVEFDPWFYGSEEKVIHSFFETLAKAIFKENHPTREAISKIMGYLSKILTKTPDLPSTFTPNPLVTEAINFAKQFLGILTGDLKDWIGHGSLNSFQDVKKLLISLLSEAHKEKELPQIIIMIDDLDRLQADEALTMLKIIRLVTDLPCIRSIVAFDEEATGRLIESKVRDGASYIRKIITVPTYLPNPEPEKLKNYFFNDVESVINNNGISINYTFLTKEKIIESIKTLRNAKVIINMFKVVASCLGNQINTQEYLSLCVIYIIAPELYSRLRKIYPPFYQREDRVIVNETRIQEYIKQLQLDKEDNNTLSGKIKDLKELLSAVFKDPGDQGVQSSSVFKAGRKEIYFRQNLDLFFTLKEKIEITD